MQTGVISFECFILSRMGHRDTETPQLRLGFNVISLHWWLFIFQPLIIQETVFLAEKLSWSQLCRWLENVLNPGEETVAKKKVSTEMQVAVAGGKFLMALTFTVVQKKKKSPSWTPATPVMHCIDVTVSDTRPIATNRHINNWNSKGRRKQNAKIKMVIKEREKLAESYREGPAPFGLNHAIAWRVCRFNASLNTANAATSHINMLTELLSDA